MTATAQPGLVEHSLEGIESIRLDVDQLDLRIESEPALPGIVRLEGAVGEHAPELRSEGGHLVLHQRGRHRPPTEKTSVVLCVPRDHCPPIDGEVNTGQLLLKDINASVNVKSGTGAVRIEGGTGPATLSSGTGHASAHNREGSINLNSGTGGVEASRINGPLKLNNGTGHVRVTDCIGPIRANQGAGDFSVSKWMGEIHLNIGSGTTTFKNCDVQHASLNSGSGAVRFERGTLEGLKLTAGAGEVVSTALLAEGPNGAAPTKEQTYEVTAGSGDITFALPKDIPARVEAIVKDGEVISDVPLVNVGRPGPKSAARRYVGVTTVSTTRDLSPLLNLRLQSDKGDITLRLDGKVRMRSNAASEDVQPGESDGNDAEVRAVLDALERKEISVDEAEALLEKIG